MLPGRMDRVLLACVLLLCLSGVLMVYSSSAILVHAESRPESAYLTSQIERVLVGILAMLILSRLPVRLLHGRTAWAGLGLGLALLVLLLLPVGLATTVRDTRRFLNLHVMQIQPAEFARLALIVFLAYYATRRDDWVSRGWKGMAVPLAAVLTVGGLIKLQPNLSSALLAVLVGFGVMFLAGQSWKRLALVMIPLCTAAVFMLKAYQLRRFTWFFGYLRGGDEHLPYHVWQSLIAVGSGGLFGTGIGKGLQKFHYLPFPHTDSILGILGEEMGFIGVLILFVLYGLVLIRGYRIAAKAPDRFSSILALGLTLSIAGNAFLHSAVVLGVGPATGVPLPFISHGGSALLANLMAVGLLLSISRQPRPVPRPVQRAWAVSAAPSRML